MPDEEEWMEKHRDMEGEGEKVMGTNTGRSSRYQNQSLETHLVRKWRDIGDQRAVGPRKYKIQIDPYDV